MGAWQLRAYLDEIRPTVVLIEGLDDAADLLSDVIRRETKPPIAILAYTDSQPVRTLVYPFARYSPEFQAICWAKEHKAQVEFIDLPSEVFLGLQDAEAEWYEKLRKAKSDGAAAAEELTGTDDDISADERDKPVVTGDETDAQEADPRTAARVSLYDQFAHLAGENDYETYWERHFEHNSCDSGYRGASSKKCASGWKTNSFRPFVAR